MKNTILFIATIIIAIVALVFVAAPAHAATWGMHAGSMHLPAREGQNNVNPGLYVRADEWTAGLYHNTYRETTAYIGHTVLSRKEVELIGGFAYGYQKHYVAGRSYGASEGAIAPMVVLTYRPPVRLFGLQPRLWLIPPTPKNSGVLHLSVEY